jgi:hypothetical protein
MAALEMCFQTLHKGHFSTPSLNQLGNGMDDIEAIGPFIACQNQITGRCIAMEEQSDLLSNPVYLLPMNRSYSAPP